MRYFFQTNFLKLAIITPVAFIISAILASSEKNLITIAAVVLFALLTLFFTFSLMVNFQNSENPYGFDSFFYDIFLTLKFADRKTRHSYTKILFQYHDQYKKIAVEKKSDFQEKINQIFNPILKEAEEKIKQIEREKAERQQLKNKKHEIKLSEMVELHKETLFPLKKPND